MASNYVLERSFQGQVRELTFAGDSVALSGQMDYPATPPPVSGSYPLIFVLHQTGWNTREDYQHYAELGLNAGYAVFRWDKRGTGRSGAGGHGSTTQDAVLAYETALDQPNINHRRVVILAQGEGTLLLGDSYGLFARLQRPAGALLVRNMLDSSRISAIDTRTHIVNGEKDWNPWMRFAHEACKAHNNAYRHGASYYVVQGAPRSLTIEGEGKRILYRGAASAIRHWLNALP